MVYLPCTGFRSWLKSRVNCYTAWATSCKLARRVTRLKRPTLRSRGLFITDFRRGRVSRVPEANAHLPHPEIYLHTSRRCQIRQVSAVSISLCTRRMDEMAFSRGSCLLSFHRGHADTTRWSVPRNKCRWPILTMEMVKSLGLKHGEERALTYLYLMPKSWSWCNPWLRCTRLCTKMDC